LSALFVLMLANSGRAAGAVGVWAPLQTPPPTARAGFAFDEAQATFVLFGGNFSQGAGTYLSQSTWLFDGITWTPAFPPASPPPRAHPSMAYDSTRGQVVLFGGCGSDVEGICSAQLADTWIWDGTTWAAMRPATSPSARAAAALADDPVHGNLVLFGGGVTGATLADTWTWDGTTWTPRSVTSAPPSRWAASFAFDAVHGNSVLYGGEEEMPEDGGTDVATLGDTWIWNGAAWTEMPSSPSPPARGGAAMAASPVGTLLFGGCSDGTSCQGATLQDTWQWNGANWEALAPASPPSARFDAAIAYDSQAGTDVLYGGFSTVATFSDTWQWDGSTWVALSSSTGPTARSFAATTYDPVRGETVMVGGAVPAPDDAGTGLYAQTWLFQHGTWTEAAALPSVPRYDAALAFDTAQGSAILFGGSGPGTTASYLNDTWAWNGTNWAHQFPKASPSARAGHAMAYDDALGEIILFGGGNGTPSLNDTWAWDGTNWQSIAGTTAPSIRSFPGMVYDPIRGEIVLFGGLLPGITATGDTWTWNGTWTQKSPRTPPPPRFAMTMVFDPIQGVTLLFGGSGPTGYLADTWSWDGTNWSLLPTASAPPARAAQASAFDTGSRRLIVFGGTSGGGPLEDTWLFDSRGGTCADGSTCDSGFCTDGVCCGAPTCGACEACNLPATLGVCSTVVNATDGDSCSGTSACDATGLCKSAPGQNCSSASTCASGFCADGVCCDEPCTGICEACNNAGAIGTCQSIKGKPVGARPACPGEIGGIPCTAAICDGTTGASCAGFVGSNIPCGTASCSEGMATPTSSCDGAGDCQPVQTFSCGSYACSGSVCATACESNADCAELFVCNPESHDCVANAAASCDGDHTLISPNGTTTDCAPYTCSGTKCNSSCVSVLGCVYPAECNPEHACIVVRAIGGQASEGCAATGARHDAGDALALGLGVGALCAHRARRAGRRRTHRARGHRRRMTRLR
jgi:hypothetical protein